MGLDTEDRSRFCVLCCLVIFERGGGSKSQFQGWQGSVRATFFPLGWAQLQSVTSRKVCVTEPRLSAVQQ